MKLPKGRTVKTPRGEFNVRDSGGQGEPLVLLHGWPESSYCWKGVVENLDGDYRIIAPDLRGLGDSTREGDVDAFRKQMLARDVFAVLNALGIKQFSLAGHDWGGVVAQEMALARPQQVDKLIIANIHVITNLRGSAKGRRILLTRRLPIMTYQFFQMAPWLPEWTIPGRERGFLKIFLRRADKKPFPKDAVKEYTRCYAIDGTPGAAANYYRSMRKDAARWRKVGRRRITTPALYLYGRRDPVIVPAFVEYLDEGFKSVKLVELDAGHFVLEERPREVAEAMSEFLKG